VPGQKKQKGEGKKADRGGKKVEQLEILAEANLMDYSELRKIRETTLVERGGRAGVDDIVIKSRSAREHVRRGEEESSWYL